MEFYLAKPWPNSVLVRNRVSYNKMSLWKPDMSDKQFLARIKMNQARKITK